MHGPDFGGEVNDRRIFLYDTFAGMTKPGQLDIKKHRPHLATFSLNYDRYQEMQMGDINLRCYASLDSVKDIVYATRYPPENFHFVIGDVLNTLPNDLHDTIGLLRLDTDWYDSTKHELQHLFDKLVPRGILISDDYGSWEGCTGLIEPDTLMRDNNRQTLRCHYGAETNIQAIHQRV